MPARRLALFALFLSAPAFAQTVKLGEKVQPGDHFRYDLQLTVDGKLKVEQDGKVRPLTLRGEATHKYAERVEAVEATGGAGKVVRHYDTAKSASSATESRRATGVEA